MSDIPEGRYPDPNNDKNDRWRDGAQWTVRTRLQGPPAPVIPPPAPAVPPIAPEQLSFRAQEDGPPPWAAEVVSQQPNRHQSRLAVVEEEAVHADSEYLAGYSVVTGKAC
jgi:hypothetical protein